MERTGVHGDPTGRLPLSGPCNSPAGTALRKSAESLQLRFKEVCVLSGLQSRSAAFPVALVGTEMPR